MSNISLAIELICLPQREAVLFGLLSSGAASDMSYRSARATNPFFITVQIYTRAEERHN